VSDTDPTLAQVEEQIAILEDNLRDLTEQAAAYSGAGDEDRSSDRIGELEQQLAALKKQRDQLS
jgi:septal ring factor EnvC (AmiA/AmiB activator)